jgi:trk system potassium uptake protein TrkA
MARLARAEGFDYHHYSACGGAPLQPIPPESIPRRVARRAPGGQGIHAVRGAEAPRAGKGNGHVKVVIAGAGEVGYHVVEALYREGVEILALDSDPGVLERLRNDFNIPTMQGNATDTGVLDAAGVGQADLFLAITNYDETNIIACLMAAEAGAKKRIARVRSIDFGHADSVSDRGYLGIDLIINPSEVAAEHLVHLVRHPDATDYNQFLGDRALLARYQIGPSCPLAGMRVLDFGRDGRIPQTLIALIQRGGESIIPDSSVRVQAGDQVYFFCERTRLQPLAQYLGYTNRPARRVFINGGGHIGYALARRLEPLAPHVRLMEIDAQRCQVLSQLLNRTLVLRVDGTSSYALKTEGVERSDCFLSVTNQDQVNIISCLLAREYGAEHTIALVKQPEYIPILESRNLAGVAFSPRQLTARKLLRFVRGENLLSFFAFPNSDVEMLELDVAAGAACAGVPMAALALPAGILVGAVRRKDVIFIPRGQDQLFAGDRILLIQQRRHRKMTTELFAGTAALASVPPNPGAQNRAG